MHSRLTVLLYHRIGPVAPGILPSLTVTPSMFRRQMTWLANRGYEAVGLDGWLDQLARTSGSSKKAVLLTFDDGYRDLVEHAYPVLADLGFGGLTFVVTDKRTNEWGLRSGHTGQSLLTHEEIAEWSARGIDFGAHGRRHADLRRLDDQSLEDEVFGSGEDLEAITGRPVKAFAYPYGWIDDRVVAMTRRRYEVAFTTAEGLNSDQTDRALLRRTMVQEHDATIGFASRVILGWSPIARLRVALATLRRKLFVPEEG